MDNQEWSETRQEELTLGNLKPIVPTVPTLVMVEDDVELKRVVGVKTKEELETWINN